MEVSSSSVGFVVQILVSDSSLQVTGSNVTSVAEHVVMSILLLVRNFVPAHEMIERGDWQVSDIARNAFDLEGKVVGTLGAGRIGYRVLQRLVPFDPKELLYYDYNPLPSGNIHGYCCDAGSDSHRLLRGCQCSEGASG